MRGNRSKTLCGSDGVDALVAEHCGSLTIGLESSPQLGLGCSLRPLFRAGWLVVMDEALAGAISGSHDHGTIGALASVEVRIRAFSYPLGLARCWIMHLTAEEPQRAVEQQLIALAPGSPIWILRPKRGWCWEVEGLSRGKWLRRGSGSRVRGEQVSAGKATFHCAEVPIARRSSPPRHPWPGPWRF